MRRAIHAHSIRPMRLFSLPPPSQSLPFTAPPLLRLTKPLAQGRPFSLPEVLTPLTVGLAAPFIASPTSFSTTHRKSFGSFLARCINSSPLNSAHTLEWNEPVSSEVVGEADVAEIEVEEDSRPSIPVRAYFFSTRSCLCLRFLPVGLVCRLLVAGIQTSLHGLLFQEAFSQIGMELHEESDVLFHISS